MKIKNFMTALLASAFVVGAMTVSAMAVDYQIANIEELQNFAAEVNGGKTYVGDTVTLTGDIDLKDVAWTPIGNDVNYFMGTFDGGNNTISNMTIDIESEGNVFAGLFGGIKKATVKNLTLEDVSINAVGAKVRAAAVAGIAHSNSENRTDATINFENITVDGCEITATAKSNSAMVGGIVGYCYPANMEGISVSNLTIDANTEGNNTLYTSAIAAYVCGQNINNNGNTRAPFYCNDFDVVNVSIEADSYTVLSGGYTGESYYGYITLEDGTIDGIDMTVDAHEAFVGGLAGYFWRSDDGHNVTNVDITNIDFDVTTDYLGETRIGGVVGTSQSPNTKYTDVTVSGKIVERCSDSAHPVNYHAKVGGFVARTYEYAMQTYTNCVADVDVTGSNVAGGFVGNHTSTVSYVNCEAKGDVTANIAGGFAGRLTHSSYTSAVTFDGCAASGDVNGENVAGGFIGSTVSYGWNAWGTDSYVACYENNITIKDCTIAGDVTSGTDYEAAIIGEAAVADGKKIILENVVYDNEVAYYPSTAAVTVNVVRAGNTGYASLEEAVAATDVEGADEIVIELLADITLDSGIQFVNANTVTVNGNGHTLTLVDNPDDDKYSNPHALGSEERPTGFSISQPGNTQKDGSVFNIKNMTIVNEKTIDRYTSGHSWRAAYYTYAYAETANYENVDFIGGVSVAENASFEKCNFTEDRENMFMVFVDHEYSKEGESYGISVEECYFEFADDAYGTFKVANKDGVVNLSVKDSTFYNSDNIPAITVDGNVESTVTGCVFENCAAGSYGAEAWEGDGPVPAVPTSGSLNGVRFGVDPDMKLSDVESVVGKDNSVHAGSIEVVFAEKSSADGELVYDINLVASNNGFINRLNSADLTFKLTTDDAVAFEILASNSEVKVNPVNNSEVRYEFHYNGKTGTTSDKGTVITIGQVKFTGYGVFSFAVDASATTNAAHATTLYDNIVETFLPNGKAGVQLGELIIDDDTISDIEILVPTKKLTVSIDFPNAIENNAAAYQNMTVTVSGTDLETDLVVELGANGEITDLDEFESKTSRDKAVTAVFADGAYTVTVTDLLTVNTSYTVTVSGAGYRTARYTVTMTEDKTLNFWNNVKDNALEVEEGKATSAKTVTYLAGDIVKDSLINIYDLSAVVSYFGEEMDTDEYNAYAKYDLNRDGKIDSKDVAYVLVSWGN